MIVPSMSGARGGSNPIYAQARVARVTFATEANAKKAWAELQANFKAGGYTMPKEQMSTYCKGEWKNTKDVFKRVTVSGGSEWQSSKGQLCLRWATCKLDGRVSLQGFPYTNGKCNGKKPTLPRLLGGAAPAEQDGENEDGNDINVQVHGHCSNGPISSVKLRFTTESIAQQFMARWNSVATAAGLDPYFSGAVGKEGDPCKSNADCNFGACKKSVGARFGYKGKCGADLPRGLAAGKTCAKDFQCKGSGGCKIKSGLFGAAGKCAAEEKADLKDDENKNTPRPPSPMPVPVPRPVPVPKPASAPSPSTPVTPSTPSPSTPSTPSTPSPPGGGNYQPSLPDVKVLPSALQATQGMVSCGLTWDSRVCLLGPDGKPMNKYTNGCHGGAPELVFDWLQSVGVVEEKCVPYVSGTGDALKHFEMTAGKVPSCAAVTAKDDATKKCFQKKFHMYDPIKVADEKSMQEAILDGGPVYASMTVYSDFLQGYKNTVYEPGSGANKVGGHAVVISGWGKEKGTKFWWGINSWGRGWGIDGKFKIRRGENTAGIEGNVYFAHVKPEAHSGCQDVTTTQHECAEKVQNVEGDEGACVIRNKCTGTKEKKGQVRMITVQGVGTGDKCGSFTRTRKVYPGDTVRFDGLLYCCPTKDVFIEELGPTCFDDEVFKANKQPGKCVLKNTCDTEQKRVCGSQFVSVGPNQAAWVPDMFCGYSGVCKQKLRG